MHPTLSRSPIWSLDQVNVLDERGVVSIGSLVASQPSEQNSDPMRQRLQRFYGAHRKPIIACICVLTLTVIILAAVYGSQKQASPKCGANSAECDPNAVCNTNGQCVCNPGYFGNGLTCTVGYVGSCAQNRTCHVAGRCSDVSAGGLNGFVCSCPSWLSGQGYSDSPCTCPLSDYPVPDLERGVCVTKRSSMSQGQVAGMAVGIPCLLIFALCVGACCGKAEEGCTGFCMVVWTIIFGLSVGLSVGLTHRTWAPLPKASCGTNSADLHLCDPNAVCNTNGQCVCNPGYFGNGLTCTVGYVGSCAQNSTCHVAGRCSDVSAGGLNGFVCSCPSWLSGQGYSDSPCTCPLSDYPVPDLERGVCVTKRSSMSQGQVAGMAVGFLVVFAVAAACCFSAPGCVFTIILGLTLGLSVGLTRNTWAPLPKVACGANSSSLHLCDYNAACTGAQCVCNSD